MNLARILYHKKETIMRKTYLIFIGLLFITQVGLSQETVKKDLSAALKAGDINIFSEHFHTYIDLSIPGLDNNVSKNQAIQALKDFFKKHPVSSYMKNHEGSSKDGSIYIIGTYGSKNGKNFRTYFLMKKMEGQFRVVQIQFDEQ